LRGIRYREGKKTKIYLRNPPGSSPKGYVTETDRQRGIKTYKGTVVMMKALNNDPHTGSLASGNLSTDNNLKRKVDDVLGEIENYRRLNLFPNMVVRLLFKALLIIRFILIGKMTSPARAII
jgi:hypothetical protein